MKLTVLVDNNTLIDRYFLAEPAVSYFIEADGKKVLFDAGYSGAFIVNAQRLSIDLLDVDYIVLSHGHMDHTWGLAPLVRLHVESRIEGRHRKRPRLVAHPSALSPKTLGESVPIGSLLSAGTLARHFDIGLSAKPVWLTECLVFLGEIERDNAFEVMQPVGRTLEEGVEQDDFLLDDSALAYKSRAGLIIVTGCSHAGICNVIEYARKVCGDDRVVDVVGGFHLLGASDDRLRSTAAYLKSVHPHAVHACHCTDLASKIALSEVVDLREVGVGLGLEYPPG